MSLSALFCGEELGEMNSVSDQPPSVDAPPADEGTIISLIDSETHHMPHPDYLHLCRQRPIDVTARQDAIKWILRVHEYYQFRPVTAFLSVNYFDRFLSIHSLPHENGWPFQLLAVACLSLAAKMEELEVPLLVDLQVSEPKFVFLSKTVQRMELWVMANLEWRLRSVTPFDFIDYLISNLPSSSSKFTRVHSISSDLIIKTTRVIDFLGFLPSTIAAAAVLSAAGGGIDFPDSLYEKINKVMVRSCHQLMEQYLIDTCPSTSHKDRAEQAAPPSPVGVLDAAACGSCDTQRSNGSESENPNSSEAEPANKRLRSSAADVQQP